jgi:hypothetical protein
MMNKFALIYKVYKKLLKSKSSYLKATGWIKSIEKGFPSDSHGNPLPWMNYPVIAFLDGRLQKSMSLFEYGSGYSTLYFAQKVGRVTSVEYNKSWYEEINKSKPDNVQLIYQEIEPDGKYCRTINYDPGQEYDIVVVDGRARVECAKMALAKISSSGVIILDDAHREEYQVIFALFKSEGFSSIVFEGLKPAGHRLDATAIFYRPGNCLAI